jgi:Pyridine nucleotide-disulphide oxidoreductase
MDAILPYAVVPGMPQVYVCGCFERWVSIYLQSVRALDLAWALVESGRIAPGARAAVVGGGFAGLTMAAALGRKGVQVTLLEQNAQLLATQRNNRVRSIHPHIHEWPRAGSLEPRAGLPLCDWRAGLSAVVVAEVLSQFEAEVARSSIRVETGAKPVVLDENRLSWRGGAAERFDAVILALGVGIEKSFGALPLRSYWSDDRIAEIGPALQHHLVTGIGEGGVIDVLYLRLRGFAHAEIAARLAELDGMRAVEEELIAIEAEVEGLDDLAANHLLWERYRALPVPPAADELLRSRLRADTRVTLNGPEPHPLAARADVLNRFLISRLVTIGALDYRAGKISDLAPEGSGFVATLDDGARLSFDQVEIRHGTVPSLKAGFPAVWERYQPVRARLSHRVPTPHWPDGWFG